MSNVAKLKKRALEYEQKKQFDKALDTYVQILDGLGEHVDEADVALYNRVGDLLLRRGNVGDAVDHYEKAVDLYTEGGFFNNAIALCNKILRNAPGRSSIYYKLGKISARKGFINDAKQNFLEYADRMQKADQLEEAFRALKEFADLCPDQDDIRLMLADQLVRKDRKAEAIEQLQALYDKFSSEGRTREARATADRMKALDPALEPKAVTRMPTPKATDLIFLDVNYDEPRGAAARNAAPSLPAPTQVELEPAPALDVVPEPEPVAAAPFEPHASGEIELSDMMPSVEGSLLDAPVEPTSDVAPLDGLSHGSSFPGERPGVNGIVSHFDSGLISGFEQTVISDLGDSAALDVAPLAELELTAHEPPPGLRIMHDTGSAESLLDGLDAPDSPSSMDLDDAGDIGGELPMLDVPLDDEPVLARETELVDEPSPAEEGGSGLTFIYPDDGDGLDASEPPIDPPLLDVPTDELVVADAPPPVEQPLTLPEPELLAPADTPAEVEIIGGAEALIESPIEVVREADRLRSEVAEHPNDWELHRRLGEALLEDGERRDGVKALEAAMHGFERDGDLAGAAHIAEELIRVEPNSVAYHQKLVEYAVRSSDKARLVDAYVALAECLFAHGQLDKSRAVFARVLELAPEDGRARAALGTFGEEEPAPQAVPPVVSRPTPPVVEPPTVARPATNGAAPTPPPVPPAAPADNTRVAPREDAAARNESFVNLADWLRDDEPKSTRLVAEASLIGPDEQVDFAEMLTMFKQGVAANVDDTDHESHYDLGVAYKEMGLLDEAISEFQKALRGTEHRVRTYEALGQCFVEKGQFQIAITILTRALADKNSTDDMLVGVLYLLGYASESLQRWSDALKYYERVFAVDIQFRDIGERLAQVERALR